MTYDYSGTCTENCRRIGLDIGDQVYGSMTAEDGFQSDGFLSGGELTDFHFTFGNVIITEGLHTAIGLLKLNSDLTIDYDFLLGGITFQSFFTGATTGNIGGLAGWTARNGLRVSGGPGTYAPAAVPEPATLALLGLGLAAVGIGSRRKARRTS